MSHANTVFAIVLAWVIATPAQFSAQQTVSAPAPPRWVLFDTGAKLLDWNQVLVVWFDNINQTATIEGPVAGRVIDAAMLERMRRAISAEPSMWFRVQTRNAPGGSPWDDPTTFEAYANTTRITGMTVLDAIDSPLSDKEVVQLFAGTNMVGRIIDPVERRRAKALWLLYWPK